MTLNVPIIDADNHLYEERDSFTKFLPDAYKNAIQYVDIAGRTKILVRGVLSDYIPNPTFEVVARPGAQEEYFRNGNPEGKTRREIFGEPMRAIPAFRGPQARVEKMDELGVERTLMFPTLASLLEERMRDDPDLTHIVVHAFNEWLYERWQFNYDDRIFTTPVITLPIVEKAVEEIDWVAERGARAVLIRPAPVPGLRGPRSFALPEFDPVWERIVHHGLHVCMHGSDSGYSRYIGDWRGSHGEFTPFKPDAFTAVQAFRPAGDAVAAWVCDGALARFPDLRVSIIELGASWVPPLLIDLANVYKKMPQEFAEEPIQAIRRAISISPFWEDDYGQLADLIGEDNVLFGSDYPHPEGLARPAEAIEQLSQRFPEETVRKFMGGNLSRLLGLGVPV